MKITQKMIADAAGVTQSAVSKILGGREDAAFSHDLRERVARIARELGYQQKNGGRKALGFVLYGSPAEFMRDAYYARFWSGVLSGVQQAERHLLVDTISDDGALPSCLREGKIDGAIVQIAGHLSAKKRQECVLNIRRNVPLVLLNTIVPGVEVTAVLPDNTSAICEAVRRLHTLGHKRIAYFGVSREFGGVHHDQRHQAFRDAMAREDLEVPAHYEHLTVPRDDVPLADRPLYEARLAADRFSRYRSLPTAVICSTDRLALEFLRVAGERGWRIPQDISLIGYDNYEAGRHSTPPLCTFDQPMEEMGRIAVEELLRQIMAPDALPRSLLLSPVFMERESIAPPCP